MAAARPYCAGVLLVTLTLVMQSAGMGGLILWARSHLVRGVHRLGLVSAALLVVRFTGLILCMHVSEILLWAIFFSLEVFCDLGIRVPFFGGKLFYGWLWGS